jgi:hypothetical protein
MAVNQNKGCAYGQVTRQKVDDIGENISEIKDKLESMDNKITDLFNHQSSRLPLWGTLIITLLSSLVVGLIVKILA